MNDLWSVSFLFFFFLTKLTDVKMSGYKTMRLDQDWICFSDAELFVLF